MHNRIQLLKWSGIIKSTYVASRGTTRFITDSDSVVHSSSEHYQHSLTGYSSTASVRVYLYLTINGFLYSAFPEYSCLAVSNPAFWCRCFLFPLFHVSHFQRPKSASYSTAGGQTLPVCAKPLHTQSTCCRRCQLIIIALTVEFFSPFLLP